MKPSALPLLAFTLLIASLSMAASTPSQFLTAPTYGRLDTSVTIAIGDFNNDGIQDLAIYDRWTYQHAEGVGILLGNAEGTFQATASLPLNVAMDGAGLIAVDFNGDGNLDLASLDAASGVDISFGHGDGTFAPPVFYSTPFDVYALATADLNGDGKPDLIVAAGVGQSIVVLLNNGDGTFGAPTAYSVQGCVTSIAIADFNGDGKADIAAACGDVGSYDVAVLLGNGDGTLRPPVNYPAGYKPSFVTVGDFNNDGKLDLMTANTAGVNVLLGNGDGTFGAPLGLSLGTCETIAVGDFNGDGKLDAAAACSTVVYILLGNGDGTFRSSPITYDFGATRFIAGGDFNRDHKADLVVSSSGNVAVMIGRGDGTFAAARSFPAQDYNGSATIADFNGDGKLDVVSGGSLLLGKGDGTFQLPSVLIPSGYKKVTSGDFNRDGKTDLAYIFISYEVDILLGNGDGTFQALVKYPLPWPCLGQSIAVADFNGDSWPDLAVGCDYNSSGSSGIYVLLNQGNGTFGPAVRVAAGAGGFQVVAGDFNGDGKIDVVFANSKGNKTSILLGNGDGTFQKPIAISSAASPVYVAAADLNHDGKLDLMIASTSQSSSLKILLGNGDGTFTQKASYPVGNVASMSIADFNGDGIPDVAALNFGISTISLMYGNGNGTFRPTVTYGAGGVSEWIGAGDFNGDGAIDLVTANSLGGDVSVLLNTKKK